MTRLYERVQTLENWVHLQDGYNSESYKQLRREVDAMRKEFNEYKHRNPDFKPGDVVAYQRHTVIYDYEAPPVRTVTLISETDNGWRVHDAEKHEYFYVLHSELSPLPQGKGNTEFATADSDQAKRDDIASYGYPMPRVGDNILVLPRKDRPFFDIADPKGIITKVYDNYVIKADVDGHHNVALAPGEYVVVVNEGQ